MTLQQTVLSLACLQQVWEACHLLAYQHCQHCRMYQSHLSTRSPSPRQICCRTTLSQLASYRKCANEHNERAVDTLDMMEGLLTKCIVSSA